MGTASGGGASASINHLHEGLALSLEGSVEKNSDLLGRNAQWAKRQKIKKLPKYLCVQFMRFFWKATPDSRDHSGVKCKIVRAVNFSEVGLLM
jgi:ubiquitin carboxyl-terminal hydrolase 14